VCREFGFSQKLSSVTDVDARLRYYPCPGYHVAADKLASREGCFVKDMVGRAMMLLDV